MGPRALEQTVRRALQHRTLAFSLLRDDRLVESTLRVLAQPQGLDPAERQHAWDCLLDIAGERDINLVETIATSIPMPQALRLFAQAAVQSDEAADFLVALHRHSVSPHAAFRLLHEALIRVEPNTAPDHPDATLAGLLNSLREHVFLALADPEHAAVRLDYLRALTRHLMDHHDDLVISDGFDDQAGMERLETILADDHDHLTLADRALGYAARSFARHAELPLPAWPYPQALLTAARAALNADGSLTQSYREPAAITK